MCGVPVCASYVIMNGCLQARTQTRTAKLDTTPTSTYTQRLGERQNVCSNEDSECVNSVQEHKHQIKNGGRHATGRTTKATSLAQQTYTSDAALTQKRPRVTKKEPTNDSTSCRSADTSEPINPTMHAPDCLKTNLKQSPRKKVFWG